jgi:hypothetical protein
MKTMAAKFGGKCRSCGGRIVAGETIRWSKASGAMHAACEAEANEANFHASDAAHARGYGDWFDDEGDWEAAEIRREEAEYMRGYHEVRQIQAFAPAGSALREQMYAEMEMAAYNRGEDY